MNKGKLILISIGGLIGLCFLCVVGSFAMDALGLLPTSTPTAIPTSTNIPTNTVIPTITPTKQKPTLTPEKIKITQPTQIPTSTFLPMLTPTQIPTSTFLPTLTPTQIPTSTFLPTLTPTQIPTSTLLPTLTPIPTKVNNPNPTQTPAATQSLSGSSEFKVIAFTQEIRRGSNANVTIQTSAGASCLLSYQTPSGNQSSAKGLGSKTADSKGRCSWTWEISPGTSPGTGNVFIAVNGNGESFPIVIK